MTNLQHVKKYITKIAIVLAILVQPCFSKEGNIVFDPSIKFDTPEALAVKDVIENAFKALVDLNSTEEDHARYHSKDYLQHSDGKALNYDLFIAHMKTLHETLEDLKIVIHDMIIKGNKVVTRHMAHAVKNDGKELEVQVIAIMEVKDGKIISCNELTHLIKGEKSDRDIGSR